MSEFSNELLLVLISGSLGGLFTLLGFIVNSVLNSNQEKVKHKREKELEKERNLKERRKKFLSPLYYYLTKIRIHELSEAEMDPIRLMFAMEYNSTVIPYLEKVEEVLKSNMDILPKQANDTLLYCLEITGNQFRINTALMESIKQHDTNHSKVIVKKEFIEGFNEIAKNLTTSFDKFANSVYLLMTKNHFPEVNIDCSKMDETILNSVKKLKLH